MFDQYINHPSTLQLGIHEGVVNKRSHQKIGERKRMNIIVCNSSRVAIQWT